MIPSFFSKKSGHQHMTNEEEEESEDVFLYANNGTDSLSMSKSISDHDMKQIHVQTTDWIKRTDLIKEEQELQTQLPNIESDPTSPVKKRLTDANQVRQFLQEDSSPSPQQEQVSTNVIDLESHSTHVSFFSSLVVWIQRWMEVIVAFVPLGFTTFGGPQAHIGILFDRFVKHEDPWLTEQQFAELFALGQSLPGPTSSQIIIAIGTIRGGFLGGFIAFVLFSMPGLIILTLVGLLFNSYFYENWTQHGVPLWFKGFEMGVSCVAVALIAQACWKLASKICNTNTTKLLMYSSAMIVTLYRPFWMFPLIMLMGAIIISFKTMLWEEQIWMRIKKYAQVDTAPSKVKEYFQFKDSDSASTNLWKVFKCVQFIIQKSTKQKVEATEPTTPSEVAVTPTTPSKETKEPPQLKTYHPIFGVGFLLCFAVILIAGVILKPIGLLNWSPFLLWFEAFYRTGSIIFGGGQVVLPMLLTELVDNQWLTEAQFFNGLALVSCLPGPMFNFSAYLGAVMAGLPGAILCWFALFLPGYFIIMGVLPFWQRFRQLKIIQKILVGVNASAIGLIVSAVYLLWSRVVKSEYEAVITIGCFALLQVYQFSAPLVVVLGGIVGIATKYLLAAL